MTDAAGPTIMSPSLPSLSLASAPPLGHDPRAAAIGVVHLGLGAFHRAHQAPVFDAMLRAGDRRWGIAAVAMRSRPLAAALAAQDGLYSLAERADAPIAPRVIGAIRETMVAADDPGRVAARIAAPDVAIVTLTITEKGYALPPGDVSATAPGLIAAGLAARHATGAAPLTILSCDNRSGNGRVTHAAVAEAAGRMGIAADARAWIDAACSFPDTMVDRITPAATDETIAANSAALGLADAAALWTEPFWQWVIEDRFAGPRPPFAAHGVQLVAEVAPFEAAKLRLLNAAHSALAYRGLLAGHRFVHQAIADPALRTMVEALWDEAAPTLDARVIDIAAYRRATLARFANPALPHALAQIAADGSQKVPPRLLATMAARGGRDSPALAGAVAGWIAALASDLPLADPLLDPLRAAACAGDVAAILAQIGGDVALAPTIAASQTTAR